MTGITIEDVELVEDLCEGYSIESLLDSSPGHSVGRSVDGDTLNILFAKYSMVRETDIQVEILKHTGTRPLAELL